MNKKHDNGKYFISLSQETLSWEITSQNAFQIIRNVITKQWESLEESENKQFIATLK